MASFVSELRRRRVFRVTAAYSVTAWLVLQAGDLLLDLIGAPENGLRILFVVLLLGLPVVLVTSWVYQVTPEGLRRDGGEPDVTGPGLSGLSRATVVLFCVALTLFVLSRFPNEDAPPPSSPTATGVETVAVLPFANIAETAEAQAFTLGIHDDLLTQLSALSSLNVISRTSVMRFRGSDEPIDVIAEALGADKILEGSVQRVGDTVRVNVQLIDAETDQHLWAERFDRALTAENVFSIQTEIASAVAAQMDGRFSALVGERFATPPTADLGALNAYSEGRQLMLTRSTASLSAALARFKEAVELDADYALAYVGLADVYMLLHDYGALERGEALRLGEPFAQRALGLAPELGEAHAAASHYDALRGDDLAARRALERAIELSPNYAPAYHWLSLTYGNDRGDIDKASQLIFKAAELDPLSPVIQNQVAYLLGQRGEFDAALAQHERVVALDPAFPSAYSGLASIYWDLGRLAEAYDWMRQAAERDPGSVVPYAWLGQLSLDLGDPAAAKRWVDAGSALAPGHPEFIDVLAEYYLFIDDTPGLESLLATLAAQDQDNFVVRKQTHEVLFYLNRCETLIESLDATYPAFRSEAPKLQYRELMEASVFIHCLDRRGEATPALVAEVMRVADSRPARSAGNVFRRAVVLVVAGETKRATELLEGAVDSGLVAGLWLLDRVAFFEALADDDRFAAVVERAKTEMERQRVRALAAESGA